MKSGTGQVRPVGRTSLTVFVTGTVHSGTSKPSTTSSIGLTGAGATVAGFLAGAGARFDISQQEPRSIRASPGSGQPVSEQQHDDGPDCMQAASVAPGGSARKSAAISKILVERDFNGIASVPGQAYGRSRDRRNQGAGNSPFSNPKTLECGMVRPGILTLFLLIGNGIAEEVRLEPGLEVLDIGDGLWLHRSDKDWGDGKPITSNGVFVVGERSIAMIDTAWTDEQTGKLIDWAEKRFGLPVRHVFSTHWHWDKMGGMGEVNRRGIAGYASAMTARLGMEHDLAPPRFRFKERIRVDLGNEIVEMYYAGPGHTRDNTVVWLERRKVLVGGCLVKSDRWTSLGYIDDADVPAWAPTLKHVLERYAAARRVIPGHGDVGDLDLVRHTIKLAEE